MSRHVPRHSLPLVTTLLLAGACGPEFYGPIDEQEFRDTLGSCIPNCPTNSPHVNGLAIGDVKLANAGSGDVKLLGIKNPSGLLYPVTTTVTEELAVLEDGVITLYGPELLSWQLVFEQDGLEFSAIIQAHDLIPSPIAGNRPMSVYALSYSHPSFAHANVCPEWINSPTEPVITVIRGETYDRELKQVNEVGSDWVTLACANEAAYKTKLLGYGPISYDPFDPVPFGESERNATLKMVTADYCGNGHSFTEQGTPISWEDAANTIEFVAYTGPFPLESYWTEDGAICLDTPRIPGMAAEVEMVCDIPACNEIDLKQYANDIVWGTRVPLPVPPPPPPGP